MSRNRASVDVAADLRSRRAEQARELRPLGPGKRLHDQGIEVALRRAQADLVGQQAAQRAAQQRPVELRVEGELGRQPEHELDEGQVVEQRMPSLEAPLRRACGGDGRARLPARGPA
jgi:hypothetical protein